VWETDKSQTIGRKSTIVPTRTQIPDYRLEFCLRETKCFATQVCYWLSASTSAGTLQYLFHCGTLRSGGSGGRLAEALLVKVVNALNLVGVRGLREMHRLERRVAPTQFGLQSDWANECVLIGRRDRSTRKHECYDVD
jgi:hypothetical protein